MTKEQTKPTNKRQKTSIQYFTHLPKSPPSSATCITKYCIQLWGLRWKQRFTSTNKYYHLQVYYIHSVIITEWFQLKTDAFLHFSSEFWDFTVKRLVSWIGSLQAMIQPGMHQRHSEIKNNFSCKIQNGTECLSNTLFALYKP